MSEKPTTIYLKDYKKHAFNITNINLEFDLNDKNTMVTAISNVTRNRYDEDLVLDGHSMKLLEVYINDIKIENYYLKDKSLKINNEDLPSDDFILKIITECNPLENTSLEGLYRSGSMFCTQCEAQGFRKITYFIDRPDNMAVYKVKIIGDKKLPVLLSNGHLVEKGIQNGRPFAIWEDPHKKPSYLFALVAGDLGVYEDKFITMSGKQVELKIYVEHGNEDRCVFAMDALKRSMKWDEEIYGREYDLDIFMIVAVSDFNFGAMENKGLNIFNAKYVLAKSDTATDTDYKNIEAIIAHEYFHNWTGNRITCRDWFQLCLKEGLTVFRDQSFSADMRSKITQRIEDVIALRNSQFSEDAGPLSHPVRPDHYIEINNFYTATVYEKGAELCRMLYHILGKDGFRKGTDLYFNSYDGMAVTVEDFIKSMADANNINLDHFLLWYSQSGTPNVTACGEYDSKNLIYNLTLAQKNYPTKEQKDKKPLYIPVKLAFIGKNGNSLETTLGNNKSHEHSIILDNEKQNFKFNDVVAEPIVSLFREFSAPVILHQNLSNQDRLLLMKYDTDYFNRYEAGQKIAEDIIKDIYYKNTDLIDDTINDYCEGLKSTLENDDIDPLFKSKILSLPSIGYLMGNMKDVFPMNIHHAREELKCHIFTNNRPLFENLYDKFHSKETYDPSPEKANYRALSNSLLGYMAFGDADAYKNIIIDHYNMNDMTRKIGSLNALSLVKGSIYDELIQDFYDKFHKDIIIMDKWFAIQSSTIEEDQLDTIKMLLEHKDFDNRNPNRVRSVLGVFAHGNLACFHNEDSYNFISEQILYFDKLNPKTASGLATAFEQIGLVDKTLREKAKNSLEKIFSKKETISNDVYEIVSKI